VTGGAIDVLERYLAVAQEIVSGVMEGLWGYDFPS